jgi:hypothetical protein
MCSRDTAVRVPTGRRYYGCPRHFCGRSHELLLPGITGVGKMLHAGYESPNRRGGALRRIGRRAWWQCSWLTLHRRGRVDLLGTSRVALLLRGLDVTASGERTPTLQTKHRGMYWGARMLISTADPGHAPRPGDNHHHLREWRFEAFVLLADVQHGRQADDCLQSRGLQLQ